MVTSNAKVFVVQVWDSEDSEDPRVFLRLEAAQNHLRRRGFRPMRGASLWTNGDMEGEDADLDARITETVVED